MTKLIKILILLSGTLLVGFLVVQYQKTKQELPQKAFATATLQRRSIENMVKASGTIQIKDLVKIGSLIFGRVDKMLVKENDLVTKDQLLAVIDDGKGDTDVLQAQATYEQSVAENEYMEQRFPRDKALHDQKFLSDDAFADSLRKLKATRAQKEANYQAYQQIKMLNEYKQIRSPIDGIIISKDISEGETATLTSPAVILYTIARSLKDMEIKLEVDENVIADLKKGHPVELSFASYPEKVFAATITDISRAPHLINNAVHYYVTLDFENRDDLFKPGMTLDAEIVVERREDALALPANILAIHYDTVEKVAKLLHKKYMPLDQKVRTHAQKSDHQKPIWTFANDTFVERVVEIGINDGSYYEVIGGINPDEKVVSDMIDVDASSEFFKRIFGRGL